jgi:hypothetical protein
MSTERNVLKSGLWKGIGLARIAERSSNLLRALALSLCEIDDGRVDGFTNPIKCFHLSMHIIV